MSQTLEITGEIVHIGEVELLPKGNTEKRIFVIEIEPGQYSQQIGFELFKDKCSLINNFNLGETVTVAFNLRGRSWENKWYVNLQAWKLAKSEVTVDEVAPAAVSATPQPITDGPDDDLPF